MKKSKQFNQSHITSDITPLMLTLSVNQPLLNLAHYQNLFLVTSLSDISLLWQKDLVLFQYVLIRCPSAASFQLHPYTVSRVNIRVH